jgi:hypothetical protein
MSTPEITLVPEGDGHRFCPVCYISINPCEEHYSRNPLCENCKAETTMYATVHSEPQCQHFFHGKCILLWLSFCKTKKRSYTCPLCSCTIDSMAFRDQQRTCFSIPEDLPRTFLFASSKVFRLTNTVLLKPPNLSKLNIMWLR